MPPSNLADDTLELRTVVLSSAWEIEWSFLRKNLCAKPLVDIDALLDAHAKSSKHD